MKFIINNKNAGIMKQMLLCLLLFGVPLASSAQQTHDLSPEEKEAFKVQCQERIDAFQMGIEIIADKRQSPEIKSHYIKTLPDMFIGKGEPWKDRNGGLHDAVKMQVSSTQKDTPKDIPLKKYLIRLRDLPYTHVEIKKAKTCLISNLYKVDDNLYMGTCTFFQYFTGQSGEVLVYRDYTQKDVDVYIQRVADGNLGTYWDMKFGDINVTETQKLPAK